jgi:hypothetical protein
MYQPTPDGMQRRLLRRDRRTITQDKKIAALQRAIVAVVVRNYLHFGLLLCIYT